MCLITAICIKKKKKKEANLACPHPQEFLSYYSQIVSVRKNKIKIVRLSSQNKCDKTVVSFTPNTSHQIFMTISLS